jgi:hypothetical protein
VLNRRRMTIHNTHSTHNTTHMNNPRPIKFTLLSAAFALAALTQFHGTALAQGPLTPPPGAPAPVMKSLAQIEARTPLEAGQPGVTVSASGEITITAKGSYYLTGNLTSTNTAASCINVGTDNVALDLNGFTITRTTGTEAGTAGILITGAANQMVMIRNGFIVGGGTNAGFANAIRTTDGFNGSVHVENVHCARVRNGIYLNYDEARNSVRNCSVETSGGYGIMSEVVTHCTVRNTVNTGIGGNSISDCHVSQESALFPGDAIGKGISSSLSPTVMNCMGVSRSGRGIWGHSVMNSYAKTTSGNYALQATVANNCTADRASTVGTAIIATVANGCYATSGTNNISFKYNMP